MESPKMKRQRRDDLTCVICEGPASCHNFGQISCHSCKEFFRRNALLPIEKTKCVNKKYACVIQFSVKYKCQRCRLLKCFKSGMRKDHLLTPEDKIDKHKRIEENRRLRLTNVNHAITFDTRSRSVDTISIDCSLVLTDHDRSCLLHIENAYRSALQSTPSASAVVSFDPSVNKTWSLATATEIEIFAAMKLITFLRLIPEFESLVEDDRVLLVKHNLVLLFALRDVLVFDRQSQMWYDDDGGIHDTIPCVRDKYAQCYRSLCILIYGYEEMQFVVSHICRIVDSLDNDPLVIQLLMIILIFQKGVAINDEHTWTLLHAEKVLHIHLQYVNLLFRYLINRYSFDGAVLKMLRIVESLFRIQQNARRFQEIVRARNDSDRINPLLKSVLSIT